MHTHPLGFRRPRAALVGAILLTATLAAPALAQGVDPATVDLTLAPGQSAQVTKTVHTPEIPPTPDIFLLFDTTASMGDDIATVQAKANDIITTIGGMTTDPAFGVGFYQDFPFSPWGSQPLGDVAYHLVQPITTNTAAVTAAINSLTLGNGGDPPEAGYEGLYQALTGAGRNLPQPDGSPPDADFTDLGEIAPGQQAGFRPEASHVILLLGDAPFHDPGDAPTSTQFAAGYPGAGASDVAGALGDVSLFCLLPDNLVLGGPGPQCSGLGATNFNVGASSADIVDAIIAALGEVDVTVTPQATCDDPNVSVSWDNASLTVTSGDDAVFVETISAGLGAPQGATITCHVEFLIDGELLDGFTQTITIHIPDVTAPRVACVEGTNPHGAKIPPAGSTTLPGSKGGQNEDGFYRLIAVDNLDPNPQIFVVDTGSGTVFGPYPSGTTIKYTEAPGATPSAKKIGSANGKAGAVMVHIIGTGDAQVYAVDASGNRSAPIDCLVPPPPK